MNPSVIVTDLTKYYGKNLALDKLSIMVEFGSVYGLIGPNGAGKTTSLAILSGLIQQTSGIVTICGEQVYPGDWKLSHRIGFFSPQFPLFDYLTGMELLLTCGLMHGLKSQDARKRAGDLLEMLELRSAAGQYIHQLSQGMCRKLQIACALIHAPQVLFLDEPFASLDPASIYRLAWCIKQLAANHRTILLSSHDMTMMERLCNRVGILHEGKLKREIDLAVPEDLQTNRVSGTDTNSRLENALWEVVGAPEIKELEWI